MVLYRHLLVHHPYRYVLSYFYIFTSHPGAWKYICVVLFLSLISLTSTSPYISISISYKLFDSPSLRHLLDIILSPLYIPKYMILCSSHDYILYISTMSSIIITRIHVYIWVCYHCSSINSC
jgi:hypothetical protein